MWLFVALFIAFAPSAQGQRIVEVEDGTDEYNFMPYELTYFVDSTNTLSFPLTSSAGYADHLRQHTASQSKDSKLNATYRIRLPVRHTVNSQGLWLLEFYGQTPECRDAYVPQSDGPHKKIG